MTTEIHQRFDVGFAYPVVFTREALDPSHPVLAELLRRAGPGPHAVLPVVDAEVLAHHPELPENLCRYAEAHAATLRWVQAPHVVPGGEICKRDAREVERIHDLVADHGLCRHSFVLAIGGGAVLDAVGYAVATAHRGLRLLRMPSTVLAQDDAGIGVKNGINHRGRKNFLGSFAPPFAVVNDFDWLRTLAPRDRRAGLAEAVKVALIKDAAFFEVLCGEAAALARFEDKPTEHAIQRCAELHLAHIRGSGDPFEWGSARPLDFGHWAAHKLEELSGHELRHGEAVAIGMALDAIYSHRVGRLREADLLRVLLLLETLGFELAHPCLRELDVGRALADFRQHLGGELCITLLDGVGRGTEVRSIDLTAMEASRAALTGG